MKKYSNHFSKKGKNFRWGKYIQFRKKNKVNICFEEYLRKYDCEQN